MLESQTEVSSTQELACLPRQRTARRLVMHLKNSTTGSLMLYLMFGSVLIFGVIQIAPSVVLIKPLKANKGFEAQASNTISCQERKDDRVQLLVDIWRKAYLSGEEDADLSSVPDAPHLEKCKERITEYMKLDARTKDGRRPRWTQWKGMLGVELGDELQVEDEDEEMLFNRSMVEIPYVPWIEGADEDNLPMTRRVQRDLWLHQHPKNCSDPSLKFLLVDFSKDSGWGLGAQLNAMAGMVAIAMTEKRVLVTNYFNRADHDGCEGSTRSHWSCYFILETSVQCRDRALELANQGDAWTQGTITDMRNYPGLTTWSARVPESYWGKPWEHMQPTTQIDGKLLIHHKDEYHRWWRAQTLRYLTRFPSKYLCTLLNNARHEAFGANAAESVLKTLPSGWPKVPVTRNETPIEKLIWSSYKPWLPRPLVSLHVRQGDKASEMNIFELKDYMNLAQRIRIRFPHVRNIWLSTEMQNVVDEVKNYTNWNFYFTNITRQTGTTTMRDYEASLGRLKSSNNAFVNLMMAGESDYFVGALGSTWVLLIDNLRYTNGKAMAGILSVNNGMFW